jgi:hypothetical protein
MKAVGWARQFAGQNVGHDMFEDLGENRPSWTAWCAAMVRDVLLHTGIKTPASWDGVRNVEAWASQHHLLKAGLDGVQRGDILIWQGGDHHIGIALGSAHAGTVESLAGNSVMNHHQMAIQTTHHFWTAHIHTPSLLAAQTHGAIGGGAATAAAVQHGGIASQFHLNFHAAAIAHGVVLFLGAYLALEAAKYITEQNKESVARLEALYDDPTLIDRDPYLKAQLQMWKNSGQNWALTNKLGI